MLRRLQMSSFSNVSQLYVQYGSIRFFFHAVIKIIDLKTVRREFQFIYICSQGRNWLPKTGWASSNAARRCCPPAPSILPKTGWAIAHPPLTPLRQNLQYLAFLLSKYFFSVAYVSLEVA